MSALCPHCRYPLEDALRADPLLPECPQCAGPLDTSATQDGDGHAFDSRQLDAILNEAAQQPANADDEPLPGLARKLPDIAAPDGPSFTQPPPAPPPPLRGTRLEWAVLVTLAVLLGLQILLADRERLAGNAEWRPVVARLCGLLGCELPPWHEPQAITMLNRNVQPAADAPGVLQVQASFRNDAPWAQAWPLLRLTLSDADGRSSGSRAFTPAEYLGGPLPDPLLLPGQTAQASLRIREPETPAVAFSFEFLQGSASAPPAR